MGPAFLQAMAALASGVCVVSTSDEFGNRLGATVTAVSSVSAEPPLVLVCLNVRSGVLVPLRDGAPFAVQILSDGGDDVARRFAGVGHEKFDGVPSALSRTGVPFLLEHTLVVVECEPSRLVEAGDHAVVIGAVTDVRHVDDHGGALIHFRRAMRVLTPGETS